MDQATIRARPLTIVALGASAGGIAALQNFFAAAPVDERLAYVVITHLAPQFESRMAEILARSTSMRVAEAQDGDQVQPGRVYVIPPDRLMGIGAGHLSVVKIHDRPSPPHPIDHFMTALADDQQEHAVGIVLSGADHDGTLGLKEIKAAGGLTLVQEPNEAEFPSMPLSAVNSGAVDAAMPVAQMPQALQDYLRHAPDEWLMDEPPPLTPVEPPAVMALPLREILALVLEHTGRDFSWYRRPMLLRRLRRRIGLRGLPDVEAYLALLRSSPDEIQLLLKDFLISVTAFFRQPEAWQALEDEVLRPMVAQRSADAGGMRVWTPGCATGEESYSIAMVLLELTAGRGKGIPVQVFGTDIDNDALEVARAGAYPDSSAGAITPARLAHFFERSGPGFVVRKALRESVLFAPQDLVRDPPFSRLDLIVCRNVLIYLEPAQQSRILEVFHYALNPGGMLFLGKSESLGSQGALFESVSREHRIFRRVGTAAHVPRPFEGHWNGPGGFLTPPMRVRPPAAVGPEQQLTQALAGRVPAAALLLDRDSRVLFFHGRTGDFLEPRGAPTNALSVLLREDLRGRVRALVLEVHHTGMAGQIKLGTVRMGVAVQVQVDAAPLAEFQRDGLVLLSFDDVANSASAAGVGDKSAAVIHDESLDRLREDYAVLEREGEHTSAELRIAHEEAMSLNEELQSSNEELQTSKEELQSMNEELRSVNGQLEDKVAELERTLADLSNLMDSTPAATLFLDRELRIRRFTEPTRRLFYLIASDEGRPLRDIAGSVDDTTLLDEAAAVRDGGTAPEREVAARDGLQYLRRIVPYRTRGGGIDGLVITYTDITLVLQAAADARRLAAVLKDSNDAVLVFDFEGRIAFWNHAAENAYGYDEAAARHLTVSMLEPPAEVGHMLALAQQVRLEGSVGPLQVRRLTRDGRTLDVNITVSALRDERGAAVAVLCTERDVSALLRLQGEMRFRMMADLIPALLKIEDAEGNAEFLNQSWTAFTGVASTQPLLGLGWQGQVHPEDLSQFRLAVRNARGAGRLFEGDFRLRNATGSYRWMRTTEVPRRDEAGALLGYVSISVDIEERRRAERAVSQEAARKDEFLAMLAHELRNPLAPLGNAVAVIEASGDDPTQLRWATGVVTRQVEQMARLVDDLMDVARVSSGKVRIERAPLDLRAVLERARDMTAPAMAIRAQRLTLHLPDAPLYVEGDLVRLTQVMANLLGNASKYSERDAGVEVSLREEGAEAVLRVMDQGAGISSEMLPRVFDLFTQDDRTLDHAEGGLGIGLTLVQRLVNAHGGSVEAHSAGRGHGSEFVVRLPILVLASPPQPAGGAGGAPAGNACNVLVVDDNVDNADTLALLLAQFGHTVRTAYEGTGALALFDEARPDVVILDIGLPGLSGYEVAQRLRARGGAAPLLLIAMTGYGRPEDVQQAEAAGFDVHLVKPVTPDRLLKLIAERTAVRPSP